MFKKAPQSKLKSPTCEEKNTKIKQQMNEREICFRVNNNSLLQIEQLEFAIWKYKVKLSRRRSIKKAALKISQYARENACVGVFFSKVRGLQVLRTPILKKSANGCLAHIMSL